MITEWFYPKELKEIIADLEAQGNLRREPLKPLNTSTHVMCILALIMAITIYFNDGIIAALITIISFYAITAFIVRYQFKYLKAYIYGEKQKVIIKKIKANEFGRAIPNSNIYCERLSDGVKITIPSVNNTGLKTMKLNIGDEINIYYSDTHKMHAVINSDLFKKEYCLRKDLMDQTSASP